MYPYRTTGDLYLQQWDPWLGRVPNDDEGIAVLESIQYYNECLAPNTIPAADPFQRDKIDPALFCQLPQLLQRLLVVTSHTFRAAKDGVDPLSRPTVRRYRALCLTELGEFLPAAVLDPFGIGLASILMLMLSDMQLSYTAAWSYHLEAARKLIALRGGLEKCINDLPSHRRVLANFVVIDILTATTCNPALLQPGSIQAQSSYLPLLPTLEEDIMSSLSPCPPHLLQAISRTSILRTRFALPPKNHVGRSSPTDSFEAILASIEAFDPNAWAARFANCRRVLPPRESDCASTSVVEALVLLGSCYKSAALIYLALSFQPLHNAVSIREWILPAGRYLFDQVRSILDIASTDTEAPLHQQVWKLITWPMVVSMYARVGWDCIAGHGKSGRDRVRSAALSMASRPLLQATQLMDELETRRGSQHTAPWTWDSGFKYRYAFAI